MEAKIMWRLSRSFGVTAKKIYKVSGNRYYTTRDLKNWERERSDYHQYYDNLDEAVEVWKRLLEKHIESAKRIIEGNRMKLDAIDEMKADAQAEAKKLMGQ